MIIGLVSLITAVLVGVLGADISALEVQPVAPAIMSVTSPTLSPTPIPAEVTDDNSAYTGYDYYGEGWVPGLVTFDTQFMRLPPVTIGSAVFYAPDVMRAQVEYRGLSMDGMVGAVAVPFCSEIGHVVWLQRPGHDWEGPFIVADCSRRNDLYGHIEFRDQVVEVDFDTAVAWGMARYGGTQNQGRWSTLTGRMDCVLLSTVPPDEYDGIIIDLSVWFLDRVEYARPSENRQQVQNYRPPNPDNPLPAWLINGTWVVFETWVTFEEAP